MNTQSGRKPTLLPLLLVGVLAIVPALIRHAHQAQTGSGSGSERASDGPYKYTNKLIGETSPYLLQHAHNPVNWYPWGAEALDKARRENKPIFLSIGYSACHWCHVMEREDFENEEIAKILNGNFISIKVDREQRPDIDDQYMLAVQMMTGSGGWPLSVFLTPDRKPFFGGTYFPPEEFKPLLAKVAAVYAGQTDAVRAQADKVAAAVAAAATPAAGGKLPSDVMEQAIIGLTRRYDADRGGFARRPKFPEAPELAFLLARYRQTGDKTLLTMVTNTLDHMAAGGIYDQLGGGFHRYSTDALWHVPHFEKMLYDQALLVPVYLDAFRITHTPRYRQVVEETLAFVSREMRAGDGGFTSTIDADSEGEEGKFTLWTPDQVRAVLGNDAPLFDEIYGVTPGGDLDGKSVLHLAASPAQVAKRHNLTVDALNRRVETMRQKMLAARDRRVHPRIDDKVLANWNGLMIAAYAQAFQDLGERSYLETAEEAAEFLAQKMMQEGKLLHCYRAGRADVAGQLEDYAFTAYGLLALYEATHKQQWLDRAQETATQMTVLFDDAGNGGFYATATQGELLARLKEAEDNATPSGNGVAAEVLAKLAVLTGKPLWRDRATRTVQAFESPEARVPSAFPTLLMAYQTLGKAPGATPTAVVQMAATPASARPGGSFVVSLHIRIQEGWHINAHQTSAAYLIPTNLRLMEPAGARLVDVKYPAGQAVRFAFSPETLSVYQNSVVVEATVKLDAAMRPGSLRARFVLSYQPCNDRSCLSPTQAQIDVPLDVRKLAK